MKDFTYKCHTLAINELPNFNSKDRLYRGMSIIDGKDWKLDANTIDRIVEVFKSHIDNLEMNEAYKQVCDSWGSDWKKVTYKNWSIWIKVRKRYKDHQLVYLGKFRDKNYKLSSIESIYYDKVISKFEKFVDEYCTDWVEYKQFRYKDYVIDILKEKSKENYIGYVYFHQNSTFKHIADTIEEVERCCKNRIGKVVYEKEKVKMNPLSSRQEKIQELEQAIARLSSQLEELKKEKDILTYKGVTLELIPEKDNYFSGIIKNAPKNTCSFYNDDVNGMREDFQRYIDELEESTNIYLAITGRTISTNNPRY